MFHYKFIRHAVNAKSERNPKAKKKEKKSIAIVNVQIHLESYTREVSASVLEMSQTH